MISIILPRGRKIVAFDDKDTIVGEQSFDGAIKGGAIYDVQRPFRYEYDAISILFFMKFTVVCVNSNLIVFWFCFVFKATVVLQIELQTSLSNRFCTHLKFEIALSILTRVYLILVFFI